jgi:hypothetical protein
MKLESLKEFQLKNGMTDICGGSPQVTTIGPVKGRWTQFKDEFYFDSVMVEANCRDFVGTLFGKYDFFWKDGDCWPQG